MRIVLIITISILTVISCSSKKKFTEVETLPKDIALKPHNHFTQEDDQAQMKKLINEIDSLINTETCTDAAEWKFSAIGSKACGGPNSYIAYPVKLENAILPKIAEFTSMQSAFNMKYGLMSDCAMVLPPAEIKCDNGKAILIGHQSEEKEVVE
ncbi:hypothetical protein [Kaistella yonginensis]|uniref:hypothetical protein n=1 Tax=Kaistella yonginensis TaxID=658267 RepID=UPI0025B2D7A7|nr:hypothetical protein [Kaistella yonginensis]MDN3607618.1 hypothetical protein [Kaistella yonginensis]